MIILKVNFVKSLSSEMEVQNIIIPQEVPIGISNFNLIN